MTPPKGGAATKNTDLENRYPQGTATGRLRAEHPDIPPEKLAAPTLGACRRQHGHTGWCEEARIAFAVELVQEAQRRILIDRLDGVMQFVAAGATPDQIMRRIEGLVDDYHGRLKGAALKARTCPHGRGYWARQRCPYCAAGIRRGEYWEMRRWLNELRKKRGRGGS